MSQNPPHPTAFSRLILSRRLELGLSQQQVSDRSGMGFRSRLSRWERGITQPQEPERFAVLAQALRLPVADLYNAAGLDLQELPSLRPYLWAKYGAALPTEALTEIASYAEAIAARYGVNTGPQLDQIETRA